MIALPYIVLLCVYIGLAILWHSSIAIKNKQQQIRVLCCCFFLIFFGLRGYVGWDVHNYYPMFQSCETIGRLFNASSSFEIVKEPGFYIYMSILKSIWSDYHFYIFCSTLIDIIILNIFLKRYHINYALGFVVFLAMMMAFEIDLQRNVKSMFLFLLSIPYIEQRRFLPFFCLNLLGFSFHLTSILYFPCYFFLAKVPSKTSLIILFVIFQTIYLMQLPIASSLLMKIGDKIGGVWGSLLTAYTQNIHLAVSKGISIGHLERSVTYIVILVNYKTLIDLNKSNAIFINAFVLYILCQTLFFELGTLANRLSLLFIFSYLIIWPSIILCYQRRNNQKCIMALMFIYCLLKVGDYSSGIFYKYENLITGISSFQEKNAIFEANVESILIDNAN